MKLAIFATALVVSLPGAASAGVPVTQPYRPANETQQWTIEGQSYGLLKVRVLINGEVVADGPMKDANFSSTYNNRPVRVTCTVGRVRFSGPADQSCAVYVENELAANLVFVRRE